MNKTTVAQQGKTASSLPPTHGILQRKCACGNHTMAGGECAGCAKNKNGLQRKLAIGASHDPLEREADRVAVQVLAAPTNPTVNSTPPRIQRFPGQATGDAGTAPASVDRVLASSGRPLEPALQQDMGQRFGHDFSRVRVHSGAAAEQSAHEVNAHAYTVGHNIVFGVGQFAPETYEGRRLLAHELTHVVQQSGSLGMVSAQHGPSLHRKVKVDKQKDFIDNPTGKGLVQTNAQTVEAYLQTLCSGGTVSVSKGSGVVSLAKDFCPTPMAAGFAGPPAPARADKSAEPTGCNCLCDMVGSANDYTIVVDDKDWPHTSGRVVTAPSPNSSKLWGAATVSGKAATIDPWLVLGHELCGHAWLAEKGLPDNITNRGEGGHQETVIRENELRKEHGIEARGSFKDPYCGESFYQDKAGPGPVQWSSYLKICEAWRKKTYGGKYKISDKIP